jgi:hypothetical protein
MFKESSIKVLSQRIAAVFSAGNRVSGQRTRGLLLTEDYIRVRRASRSPMAGQLGQIVSVSVSDPLGAYLVEFDNGMRFRYQAGELERVAVSSSIPAPPIQCHQ